MLLLEFREILGNFQLFFFWNPGFFTRDGKLQRSEENWLQKTYFGSKAVLRPIQKKLHKSLVTAVDSKILAPGSLRMTLDILKYS